MCVFYLRGKLNLSEFTQSKWRDCCCISEVTMLELHFGAENSNNPTKQHEVVAKFSQNLTVIPVHSCRYVYSQEKTRFQKIGKPQHDEFDLIIGASAIANGLTLITDNIKHFQNFENIKIENWFIRS
jgi:tRNA(fMet)-specific endonuclease VapC